MCISAYSQTLIHLTLKDLLIYLVAVQEQVQLFNLKAVTIFQIHENIHFQCNFFPALTAILSFVYIASEVFRC